MTLNKPTLSILQLLFLIFVRSSATLSSAIHHSGVVLGSAEGALHFHSLSDAACNRLKFVRVYIHDDNVGVGASGVTLKLLESSRDFIPSDAPADRGFASGGGHTSAARPCYYQGEVVGTGGPAVAKLSPDGLFSATFHHHGVVYEVRPEPLPALGPPPVFRGRPLPPSAGGRSRRCSLASGASFAAAAAAVRDLNRGRRSVLPMDMRSDVAQPARKFIQLVLVGDEALFKASGSDSLKTQDRLWEIGNYVNSLYKQLGASVVTVRAVVLATDPYTLANKTTIVSSTEMLDKFMAYRMQYLSDITHNVAHLISGLRMTGAEVGLAHLGKLCQFAYGGGVNSDTDVASSAINVAVTVAHELGHNLGMNHDEDDVPCACPDPQGCIMKGVGGDVNPLRFSSCSVNRYLQFTVDAGLGYCMSRPPDAAVKSAGDAPRCGNRIVEPGEDCDCGPAAWCNNSCCNPSTCKFIPGAKCASGQCCNTSTCTLAPLGSVCRAARTDCDLPEFCNGSSEWCPDFDDYVLDGTVCATNSATDPGQALAYCYSGDCVTRDRRCVDIFNGTNYRSAPDPVYNLTLDASSSDNGYCGYSVSAYSPVRYAFSACTVENRRCGTLYCIGIMTDTFPVPKWKSMAPVDARLVTYTAADGSTQDTSFARLDLRPSGFRDPGMVPNGAECGSGLMCVDSLCLPVATVRGGATAGRALPNCNGNGRWAQSIQCYCNAGFRPPDCLLAGAGGSATNHPTFSESAVNGTAAPTTSGTATTSNVNRLSTTSFRLEFTTLNQTRDDFWLFVGIGIAAAVIFLHLVAALAVLLWLWCRNGRPPVRSLLRLSSITDGIKFSKPGSPGFGDGPPAHLAEFYESVRRGDSWKGRRHWPPPGPIGNGQVA